MTPSKTLWQSLEIDRGAEVPEAPVRELLAAVCRRPGLHARFLNTLSLLEHIGSRKITLSQSGALLAEDVLRHMAEEARHAHFFRKAAERIASRSLDYGDAEVLAGPAARMYFGRLDAAITRELAAAKDLAYRYVTLAVELRALWLYRLYEETLREGGVALTLSSVLSEEDAHLREMDDALRETDPLYPARRKLFSTLEARLFERWLSAVRRASAVAREQSELPL